jgi:hypothetical protein
MFRPKNKPDLIKDFFEELLTWQWEEDGLFKYVGRFRNQTAIMHIHVCGCFWLLGSCPYHDYVKQILIEEDGHSFCCEGPRVEALYFIVEDRCRFRI